MPFALTPADKKLIDAFLDKKPGDSKNLHSDGKQLDILGLGGSGVAKWVGDKIELHELGGRSDQTVRRYIEKVAPKSWIKASSLRSDMVRIAAGLPQGDPTRRAILSALQDRAAGVAIRGNFDKTIMDVIHARDRIKQIRGYCDYRLSGEGSKQFPEGGPFLDDKQKKQVREFAAAMAKVERDLDDIGGVLMKLDRNTDELDRILQYT